VIESKETKSANFKRVYTADGYAIIYDESINDYKILHPTGGISTAKSYVN
jgi:hypothetical protein